MTTLAQIAANRRNALHSTGPRSSEGKLVVAQNAVRHGIFARLPVVTGESPDDWQAHRSGVVASLGPVGLLEVTLAERAALLLWRLARLARYEAAATSAGVEDAGLLPPGFHPIPDAMARAFNDDTQLTFAEQELRRARENLAAVAPDAHVLRRLRTDDGIDPFPPGPVRSILNAAFELAENVPLKRFAPDLPFAPAFLERLGLAGVAAEVAWTRDRLVTALGYYAEAAGAAAADFRAELQMFLDARAARYVRAIERLEAEVSGLARRSASALSRERSAALLPPEPYLDRLVKYEKHLHSQLTSTLHELERLQGRRAGAPVIPPAAADLNVIVSRD